MFFFAVLTSSLEHPHHWRPSPWTGQRSCFRAVLSSIHEFLVLVTVSEVLRDGSTDISAVHCPRGQVFFTHVANLNFSFAPSHGLFRGCVNARRLFLLALSTFCGTISFPLFCTSAGFHPESSRLEHNFASCWQKVLRSRHRIRKMMTRSSSRCI